MKLSLEISMYPLHQNYIPLIDEFLEGLNRHDGVEVKTNFMSTHLIGDFDTVMAVFTTEIKEAYARFDGKIIFVTKFLNS